MNSVTHFGRPNQKVGTGVHFDEFHVDSISPRRHPIKASEDRKLRSMGV